MRTNDGNSVKCTGRVPNKRDNGTAYCNSICTAYYIGDCYWSGC